MQEIVRSILYYAFILTPTLPMALNTTPIIEKTEESVNHLLNYFTFHPDASIQHNTKYPY